MRKEFLLFILVTLVFAGCGRNTELKNAGGQQGEKNTITYPYKIVTTCGMVTDIVTNVAGDKANVTGLMSTGVDPHLHKPTRTDQSELHSADVVFYSGLMLEGRMADSFTQVGRKGKFVSAVTESLAEEQLESPDEFEGHWDPHVWTDIKLWSQCVSHVADMLAEYDADNAEFYKKNAEEYVAKLAALDDYAKEAIATIPQERRVLITAHDAFGYFSKAYGIEVKSVQGLTTESAAGVDDINKLVDYIVEHQVPAIFVEDSVSDKSILAVIEGAKQRGQDVTIGGTLFSDSMGPEGTYEGTYEGMMDHNVTMITRALGGTAQATGLNGKLSAKEHSE